MNWNFLVSVHKLVKCEIAKKSAKRCDLNYYMKYNRNFTFYMLDTCVFWMFWVLWSTSCLVGKWMYELLVRAAWVRCTELSVYY